MKYSTARQHAKKLLTGTMSVALAATLAAATVVPVPALAAAGSLTTMDAQQDAKATVTKVERITLETNDGVENAYVGGVALALEVADGVDLSMLNSVTLNGTEYDYGSNLNRSASNAYTYSGGVLKLTNEALVEGVNTLDFDLDEEDGGSFTITIDTNMIAAELAQVEVDWEADYSVGEYIPDSVQFSSTEKDESGRVVELPSVWRNAISEVKVGETTISKSPYSSVDTGNDYAIAARVLSIGVNCFVDGENTVTITADGYEDVVLTVVFDSENKTATLKAADDPVVPEIKQLDVEWELILRDEYGFQYLVFSPAGSGASLPAEWRNAVTSVKVGDTQMVTAEYGSVYSANEFAINDRALSVGLAGMVNGKNIVTVAADGYEDVVFTVLYDEENKTASFASDDSDDVDQGTPIVLADGTYQFGASVYKTGTEEASHVSGLVDSNVKLVKTDEGYELSLLIPSEGEGTLGAMASMIKDVAVTDAEGSYISGSKTRVSGVGVQYSFKAASFNERSVIAFGVDAPSAPVGGHQYTQGDYDTYSKADLMVKEASNWWAGYAAQAPVNLEDGVYRMNITTMLERSAGQFEVPPMGNNVLGSSIWITVKDGAYTASLDTESVLGYYLSNYRSYTQAGDYRANDDAESYLRNVRTVTRQRTESGSIYTDANGTYADVISFDLPGKGADPYAFLRMELIGSNMPIDMVGPAVWSALMDWSSLEKIDETIDDELTAQVAAAEKIAADESVKAKASKEDWDAFLLRLEMAQDALKVGYTLTTEGLSNLTSSLKDASEKVAPSKDDDVVVDPKKDGAGKNTTAGKKTDKSAAKGFTVNVKTVTAKTVAAAAKKAGATNASATTITLGKKVKTVKASAFKSFKKVKTIVVKTKKLTKKSVKKSLKGSKVKTVKVQIGSKKQNKKYVKKYKKVFTKKIAGKRVSVKK